MPMTLPIAPIFEIIPPIRVIRGPPKASTPVMPTIIFPNIGFACMKFSSLSTLGMTFALIYCAIDAIAGATAAPSDSARSPSEFFICWIFPSGVASIALFMLPTFCVMTFDSIAAFSVSVPYLRTFSCPSVNDMPTLLRAPT